jgi:hypothetical protein
LVDLRACIEWGEPTIPQSLDDYIYFLQLNIGVVDAMNVLVPDQLEQHYRRVAIGVKEDSYPTDPLLRGPNEDKARELWHLPDNVIGRAIDSVLARQKFAEDSLRNLGLSSSDDKQRDFEVLYAIDCVASAGLEWVDVPLKALLPVDWLRRPSERAAEEVINRYRYETVRERAALERYGGKDAFHDVLQARLTIATRQLERFEGFYLDASALEIEQ